MAATAAPAVRNPRPSLGPTRARANSGSNAASFVSAFEAERPRLVGLAYRMLGTRDDAEDAVQEAWLRWNAADRGAVENVAAWLTTTVSRLALDRLRVCRRERERYVGPWLPEPVVLADLPDPVGVDPAERAVRAESLSLGFLHMMERLSPRERVAFVLTEVFDEPHAVVGDAVGASVPASRQLVRRARRKLDPDRGAGAAVTVASAPGGGSRDRAGRACRPAPGPLADVLTAFLGACAGGEIGAFLRVLAPDVVLVSDGGAERHAARRPVVGDQRVARLLRFVTGRVPSAASVTVEQVNGEAAIVVRTAGRPALVVVLEAEADRVRRVRIVLAPDKLRSLDAPFAAR